MATQVVKIVDPDGGSGYDYTSLTAWEAGEQKDLVSADEIAIARCRNTSGSDDTSEVYIYGWTTDATRYIRVEADSGYETDGINGNSCFTVKPTTGTPIRIREPYTEVEGLKIDGVNATGSSLDIDEISTIKKCLLVNQGSGVANVLNSGAASVLENCSFIECEYVYVSGGTLKLYNCSFYSGSAVNRFIRDAECYNVVVYAPSSSYNMFYNCTGDYNCSSDASAPGTNSLTNQGLSALDFVSTTSGSEDLHIQSTSDLIGAGIGPASDGNVPTTDIDGDTRSGTTTDIGFDLYVAGGTTYQFSADINGVSSTPAIELAVARELAANIAGAGATSDIDLTRLMALSAQIAGGAVTGDVDLSVARAIVAGIAAISSTADIDLAVLRRISAGITAASSTSAIELTLAGIVTFAASIAGVSITSDLSLSVARMLAAAPTGQSSTADIVLSAARQLNADINAQSLTSAIDLVISALGLIANPSIRSLSIQRSLKSKTPQRSVKGV